MLICSKDQDFSFFLNIIDFDPKETNVLGDVTNLNMPTDGEHCIFIL